MYGTTGRVHSEFPTRCPQLHVQDQCLLYHLEESTTVSGEGERGLAEYTGGGGGGGGATHDQGPPQREVARHMHGEEVEQGGLAGDNNDLGISLQWSP